MCSCTEIMHLSGQFCVPCPNGYISNSAKNQCLEAPKSCTGPDQIEGNRNNCYGCRTCELPMVPSPDRTSCMMVSRSCGCAERMDVDGNCYPCEFGTIADASGSTCIPSPPCLSNQLLGTRDNCFKCTNCLPPTIPDPGRSNCVLPPKPTCQCFERFSTNGYSCIPC